jgi:hypothetical protein
VKGGSTLPAFRGYVGEQDRRLFFVERVAATKEAF